MLITFLAMRLVPGDVVDILLNEYYDPKVAEQMRNLFGLNLPLHVQFLHWAGGLLHGDLGSSLVTGRSVMGELLSRFPATLELTISALLLSLVIAIPAGIVSATRRNTPWDYSVRVVSLLGLSTPNFFLGVLLILLFAVTLHWLPSGGYQPWGAGPLVHLRYLILPTVTLGTAMAAIVMRMTRSSMLEVLRQDYVRTARAKGLGERRIAISHALRNALIPVVTVVGIQVGFLLGGAVIVEKIFSWPGLGTLIVNAIIQRDYPLVQGAVLALALFFVAANFAVDLLYLYLNPRLRHG